MTAADGAAVTGGLDLDAPATVAHRTAPHHRPKGVRWFRALGWRYLVAFLAILFALLPAYFVVLASISPVATLQGTQLLPREVTSANYTELFDTTQFWTWLGNSLRIAGGAAAANVVLSAMAAYAFSRLRFTGRRPGLLAILLVQMFPQLLANVAIFLFMVNVRNYFPAIGFGTQLGLFLVYLGGALGANTWLMKGFFDTLPTDLDESARIDGATHGQIFVLVILPLALPILVVTGLLSFILLYNEFILASILLGQADSNQTLATGLYRFIATNYGQRWGPFAAGALIGSIPTLLLFLVGQRWIVGGLTAGAVKG